MAPGVSSRCGMAAGLKADPEGNLEPSKKVIGFDVYPVGAIIE